MTKKSMIIDTDAGPDDCLAILLALAMDESWEVVAVTCVFGNTTVGNVCNNVMKVLKLCNKTQIPVHSGCDKPLVWQHSADLIFSEDGLGGVGSQFSHAGMKIAESHAANALVKLAEKHRDGDLHLVAIGPLTNVAMAHRLDPNFTKNLKSIVIMGGNVEGIGNATSAAEFNFFCDPESAHIVLNEAACPLKMTPWETTLKHLIPWNIYEDLCRKDSERARFFKTITSILDRFGKIKKRKGVLDCDFLAVASLVCPESIKAKLSFPVSVEVQGKFTRGQAIVERRLRVNETDRNVVDIITEFDEILLNSLRNLMLK